jgi:pilus assembly protein Flp/PilA
MRNIIRVLRDRRGATAIEYALIASLISVAAIVSFNALGTNVSSKYDLVDNNL